MTSYYELDADTNYYESARDMTITRDRAVQELEAHGYDYTDLGRAKQAEMNAEFFAEVGDRDEYEATEVLDWLGYGPAEVDADEASI